jgi:hypothetical protein
LTDAVIKWMSRINTFVYRAGGGKGRPQLVTMYPSYQTYPPWTDRPISIVVSDPITRCLSGPEAVDVEAFVAAAGVARFDAGPKPK